MVEVEGGKVLVLDDQPAIVEFLVRLLECRGYRNVSGLTDPRVALERLRAEPIDLLVLDLRMTGLNGFEVLREVARIPHCELMPVLVLTGSDSRDVRNRALACGARDFLAKPFDADEAVLRIHNLLLTRLLLGALTRQNEELEERVRQRTAELEAAQVEILTRLATLAEHHDEDTAEHTRRVATLSGELALALGLDPERASLIAHASLLHDVGKTAVPVEITRKPGPLSPEERQVMTRHPVEGAKMLGGSQFQVLQQAEEIARTHHERWDGTGYPAGLAGAVIPLAGRIVAVADVFDALTSMRPYKPARSHEDALAEIRRIRGSHLDPAVVDALESVLRLRVVRAPADETGEPGTGGSGSREGAPALAPHATGLPGLRLSPGRRSPGSRSARA
jgi:putative two-component system response regulator